MKRRGNSNELIQLSACDYRCFTIVEISSFELEKQAKMGGGKGLSGPRKIEDRRPEIENRWRISEKCNCWGDFPQS